MLVVRPAQSSDLDDLIRLAKKAGKGLTSLPDDRAAMTSKIEGSVASFSREARSDSDHFLFVLEDISCAKVVGTAAIFVRTGARQAFYAYRVQKMVKHSHCLDMQVEDFLLQLTNDYSGCSEVGTLFLDPEYRGNGRLLTKTRYLFMGLFQSRFENEVIAEMRGWNDSSGNTPFWEAIGRKFFKMSFEEADRLCGVGTNQFITELMPRFPIYGSLLSSEACECIGKPHDDGVAAKVLLEREGFDFEGVVDIFDGGPMLRAKVENLKTVQRSREFRVTDIEAEGAKEAMLISNGSFKNFRVICAPLATATASGIYMPDPVKEALSVTGGQSVFVTPYK